MNTRKIDTFEYQFKKFKYMLVGSKSAKISAILLITVSLVLAFKVRDDFNQMIPLVIGAIVLIIYMVKFLSLKNIKQKSYTQTSLTSSISKFKKYMANRKKYEMYFMSFWILSIIPFASSEFTSVYLAILFAGVYIGVVAFLGNLAFRKVDRDIVSLEAVMQKELATFK